LPSRQGLCCFMGQQARHSWFQRNEFLSGGPDGLKKRGYDDRAAIKKLNFTHKFLHFSRLKFYLAASFRSKFSFVSRIWIFFSDDC
jgi:hypothetical protein